MPRPGSHLVACDRRRALGAFCYVSEISDTFSATSGVNSLSTSEPSATPAGDPASLAAASGRWRVLSLVTLAWGG